MPQNIQPQVMQTGQPQQRNNKSGLLGFVTNAAQNNWPGAVGSLLGIPSLGTIAGLIPGTAQDSGSEKPAPEDKPETEAPPHPPAPLPEMASLPPLPQMPMPHGYYGYPYQPPQIGFYTPPPWAVSPIASASGYGYRSTPV